MPRTHTHVPKTRAEIEPEPFETAEDAWFWFIQAYTARHDGAKITADAGAIARPCEPVDILVILEKLYRNRRLLRDHVLVLRHYGKRQIPPDPSRLKEVRAHTLWKEALRILEDVFIRKAIIHARCTVPGIRSVPFENGEHA